MTRAYWVQAFETAECVIKRARATIAEAELVKRNAVRKLAELDQVEAGQRDEEVATT